MTDHINIKVLISADFDGEATAHEKKLIEEHCDECEVCRDYSRQLNKLSATLNTWTNENPSPDLEQKTQRGFKEATMSRDKKAMHKRPLFKVGVGGGGILVAILVLFLSIQTYSQRALQQRVREAEQYLAAQTESPGTQKSTMDTTGLYSSIDNKKTNERDLLASSKVIGIEQEFWGGGGPQRSVASKAKNVGKGFSDKREMSQKTAALGGAVQYEPYYLTTNYEVTKNSNGFQTREGEHGNRRTGDLIYPPYPQQGNTEQYDRIYENQFLTAKENPVSTLSIDVDTASYSNMRRFLNNNQLPPADAVRIEEMVNYFTYDYSKPQGEHPFSITTRASVCPWNKDHQLVQIGLQGKTLEENELRPSNLVFLIDVSGSMNQANKLPLLKTAFKMLVNQLGDNERVAIVVYAGAAGKVLDSTPGSNKQAVVQAIDNLQAGGSTAGGAGIKLAYKIARENFIKNGNNRVILATDGDFNVGASSNAEMVRLIEEERKAGTFLTVLGFGTGNYKDSRMEQIADKGNGNYYYIDTQREAKKVLVSELGSTLFTIAKDVKLQIEFNPSQIKAYRLIGYENRILAKEDFNDDTKDAGELGAGHTVTAFYEIVSANSNESFGNVDDLKYQQTKAVKSSDLMTVKLRYKEPDGEKSKLITQVISENEITANPEGDFQFASAVAEFGLLLRKSQFKANASYQNVLNSARTAMGKDSYGYRGEFITLVEKAQMLDVQTPESPGIMFKGP